MYQIAEQVQRWLAEGRPVRLARVVRTAGISSRDRAAAVGYSPDQPLAGQLFDGAGETELVALLAKTPVPALVWFTVTEAAAAGVGLSCGGRAQLLVQPAEPGLDWAGLLAGKPACVVTELSGELVGATTSYRTADLAGAAGRLAEAARLFRQGVSQSELLADGTLLCTALWPAVRVLVVGTGQIADALAANAALLGWQLAVLDTLPAELSRSDNVIVLSHDLDASGAALAQALAAQVGYVGALGSRHTQAARAGWLTEHGVPADRLARIHGPAGLNIGSRTPAEIALSILAEMVQVRHG
ncbi:MAG: XdhC family protein [Jatrophihabitantaceae bacterium]